MQPLVIARIRYTWSDERSHSPVSCSTLAVCEAPANFLETPILRKMLAGVNLSNAVEEAEIIGLLVEDNDFQSMSSIPMTSTKVMGLVKI